MFKTMSWVETSQLTRAVSQKEDHRSQKARLERLKTSPELWTLMDEFFVFVLADGTVYTLFYGLYGTSIMESVVLRSGGLIPEVSYEL